MARTGGGVRVVAGGKLNEVIFTVFVRVEDIGGITRDSSGAEAELTPGFDGGEESDDCVVTIADDIGDPPIVAAVDEDAAFGFSWKITTNPENQS